MEWLQHRIKYIRYKQNKIDVMKEGVRVLFASSRHEFSAADFKL